MRFRFNFWITAVLFTFAAIALFQQELAAADYVWRRLSDSTPAEFEKINIGPSNNLVNVSWIGGLPPVSTPG